MGGPSSMSQPQNEADMPPAASLGGAGLPIAMDRSASTATRFKAGARVFFDSNDIPVKGTVAKPNATGQYSHVPMTSQICIDTGSALLLLCLHKHTQ